MATPERRVIALAIDTSEYAEYAFDWYEKFMHKSINEARAIFCTEGFDAREFGYVSYLHHKGTQMIVLHVPEDVDLEEIQKEIAKGGQMKESLERQYSKIAELEDRFRHKMQVSKINGTVLSIPAKNPGQAIIDAAREEGAFAIVMGTRGRSKLKKALLGSVSDFVVKNADIPVIVVRKSGQV